MNEEREGAVGSDIVPPKRRGRRPKPDAKAAQINIRLDPQVKAAGDVVLARLGLRCSDVVRSLYEYLVREQALPEGMQVGGSAASASWGQEAGFATRMYQELTGHGAQLAGAGVPGSQVLERASVMDAPVGKEARHA